MDAHERREKSRISKLDKGNKYYEQLCRVKPFEFNARNAAHGCRSTCLLEYDYFSFGERSLQIHTTPEIGVDE